jgi:hypothetical protein
MLWKLTYDDWEQVLAVRAGGTFRLTDRVRHRLDGEPGGAQQGPGTRVRRPDRRRGAPAVPDPRHRFGQRLGAHPRPAATLQYLHRPVVPSNLANLPSLVVEPTTALAKERGLSLTGPDGLLKQLTRRFSGQSVRHRRILEHWGDPISGAQKPILQFRSSTGG